MLKKHVLAALCAAVMLGACSKDSSPATDKAAAGKAYIVATDASYAPFEYMENDKVVGFSHDVLEAAGAKEGIKFDFVNTPFEGIFANVDKGDSDVALASITITDERKKQVDFSEPYFEATQMIVTADKGSDVKSFADLKNRMVSVQNGTTGDLVIQELQGKDSTKIKRFETMPLAFKELQSGGVDASVGDNGVVQHFVSNNPNIKLNTVIDPNFEKEFYGFVVKKGRSDDLLSKINQGLAAIKADGTYDKIYNHWFQQNVAPTTGAASAASASR